MEVTDVFGVIDKDVERGIKGDNGNWESVKSLGEMIISSEKEE